MEHILKFLIKLKDDISVYWHKIVFVQSTWIKTNPKYSMLVLIAAWQDANPRKRAAAGHHHLPWWQKPNMELEKGSQGR